MDKKEKLIARLYRITRQQDELVKHNAKIFGGESEYIRRLIDEGVLMTIKWVPVLDKKVRSSSKEISGETDIKIEITGDNGN